MTSNSQDAPPAHRPQPMHPGAVDGSTLPREARDRLYAACARAVSEVGLERESLFLARLALLLFEQVGDEARCLQAIDEALRELPSPSLSAI